MSKRASRPSWKRCRVLNHSFSAAIPKTAFGDIVEEQVSSFSVSRLEEMVVYITNTKLSMITYLGALLGGIIGLFQGFVTVLIG
ncbi:DUF445 family protein [Peribacillus simplex]|uniref:DUF445 family protein n=1 Tax=Peribacillus simplex TaxID=1478 RepID=UPI003CF5222C